MTVLASHVSVTAAILDSHAKNALTCVNGWTTHVRMVASVQVTAPTTPAHVQHAGRDKTVISLLTYVWATHARMEDSVLTTAHITSVNAPPAGVGMHVSWLSIHVSTSHVWMVDSVRRLQTACHIPVFVQTALLAPTAKHVSTVVSGVTHTHNLTDLVCWVLLLLVYYSLFLKNSLVGSRLKKEFPCGVQCSIVENTPQRRSSKPTDVCKGLYIQYFPESCGGKKHGQLGGIRTHDLCHSRADVLPLDHQDYPVARGSSIPIF